MSKRPPLLITRLFNGLPPPSVVPFPQLPDIQPINEGLSDFYRDVNAENETFLH